MLYFIPFVISLILSLVFTPPIRQLALRYNIVDAPTEERKIQKGHVPLLGGLAVYFSFLITLLICWGGGLLSDGKISISKILGIISADYYCIVGFLDDRYNLKPNLFIGPSLFGRSCCGRPGITIGYITNPFLAGTGPMVALCFISAALLAP